MSGLAGVRWLDDRRKARIADVRSVLGRLSHRGPDGFFAAATGPCVAGAAHFVTTPEAAGASPVVASGSLTVTFDGRLDNRAELEQMLGSRARHARSDAALVTAAWHAWDVDSLEHLVGDFALVVWDAARRKLFLARDVFGLRPLLYRAFDDGFWWASELQALARLGDASVNDAMAAEYLGGIRSETETLVRGVYRVPRASVLVLNHAGSSHVTRYWSPRVNAVRTFHCDDEAVEEFRAVFSPAVSARLRADRPVGLTLSGGLDSSLIAAEAASLHRAGRAAPVHAYTLALAGHASDESRFAQDVATHVGMSATVCNAERPSLAAIIADAARALDIPQPPNSVAADPLSRTIRAQRVRVCLNGVGGNEWFSGYHFPFADLLRQLRWIDAASRMAAFKRESPAYRPLSDVRLALWLQLPETVKRRLRTVFGLTNVPGWIRPSFARRVHLAERLRPVPEPRSLPTLQLQLMLDNATNADQMFLIEYTERISARYECEERSPFLDRRLVEWALALPDDQRWRQGAGKVLLRNAAAPLLPEGILHRGRGPVFSFQTADGLQELGGQEFVLSIARARGEWVDPAVVRQLWARMTGAEDGGNRGLGYYSWALWMLVGVHLAALAIEETRSGERERDATLPINDCTICPSLAREAV